MDIVAPSGDPVKIEPGEEVKFEAIARDDWGQDLTAQTQWTWDFGDGQKSNENPVYHVFASRGSFTVTVSGRCGELEASDVIILQLPGEPWSLGCKIVVEGGPDIGVAPNGDVCHVCEVSVAPGDDPDPWEMRQSPDFWSKEGDGEWQQSETQENDTALWETGQNVAVQWKAEVHLAIWDDEEQDWTDEIDFWVGPETWNVKNTVVTSDNDVLRWDPEDPEGSAVTVPWTIVHSTATNPTFNVTIHICNLAGDVVREFSPQGPIGVGQDSADWDGQVLNEEEELEPAGKGVYAYKVFASDQEDCEDCDKTETYTPWIEKFY